MWMSVKRRNKWVQTSGITSALNVRGKRSQGWGGSLTSEF